MPFIRTAPQFYPLIIKVSIICALISTAAVIISWARRKTAGVGLLPFYIYTTAAFILTAAFHIIGDENTRGFALKAIQGIFGALPLIPAICLLLEKRPKSPSALFASGAPLIPAILIMQGLSLAAVNSVTALTGLALISFHQAKSPSSDNSLKTFPYLAATLLSATGNFLDMGLVNHFQESPLLMLILPALAIITVEITHLQKSPEKKWESVLLLIIAPLAAVGGILLFRHMDATRTAGGSLLWDRHDRPFTAALLAGAFVPVFLLLRFLSSLIIKYIQKKKMQAHEKNAALTEMEILKAKEEMENRLKEEKLRLAGDIHDTLAQETFAARLQINLIEKSLKSAPPATRKDLETLRSLVDEAQRQSRIIIEKLKTPTAEANIIDRKLSDFVRSLENRSSVKISAKGIDLIESLSDTDKKHHLEMMAREALNNAIKHSNGEDVCIRVRIAKNRLNMLIIDNGSGFDVKTAERKGRFGLQSINNRCREISATVIIRSINLKGTAVLISCNL